MNKPWSEACERNKGPILEVLRRYCGQGGTALEIGSGTGQHAVFFAEALPQLCWQPTELAENLPGLRLWVEEAALANLRSPEVLDVFQPVWPLEQADYIFTANTLHIMPWEGVEALFRGVERVLRPGGMLLVYGPFRVGGRHTAPSNARFDTWLKARDPASGVRDLEAVQQLAEYIGLEYVTAHAMPANNWIQVWRWAEKIHNSG